jgi:hypothetical protein
MNQALTSTNHDFKEIKFQKTQNPVAKGKDISPWAPPLPKKIAIHK